MNKLQLELLINKIYKILPLKETNNENLLSYLDGVSIQLAGAYETNKELLIDSRFNRNYLEIINTINFMKINDFSTKTCKREVFKCISILNKIVEEIENDKLG